MAKKEIEDILADVASTLEKPMDLPEAANYLLNAVYQNLSALRAYQVVQKLLEAESATKQANADAETAREMLATTIAEVRKAEAALASTQGDLLKVEDLLKEELEEYRAATKAEILDDITQSSVEAQTELDALQASLIKLRAEYEREKEDNISLISNQRATIGDNERKLKQQRNAVQALVDQLQGV